MIKVNERYRDHLSWDEKANINPLYAVMSEDRFLNSGSQPNSEELDAFYKKGELIWSRIFLSVFSSFIDKSQIKVVEYGCGMGRLLRIPFAAGATCFGVDISEKQLELAYQYTFHQKGPSLIKFNPKQRISLDDSSIDFVYSYAVLQHIQKTSDFLFAVKEMIRLVKPGGIVKFQFRTLPAFTSKGECYQSRASHLKTIHY